MAAITTIRSVLEKLELIMEHISTATDSWLRAATAFVMVLMQYVAILLKVSTGYRGTLFHLKTFQRVTAAKFKFGN